jgi:hypothetical protein
MKNSEIFLAFVIIFWLIFAINSEVEEQKNCYIGGISRKKDDIYKSLDNIKICVTYDYKSIKWRRSYIISNIITFLIFLVIHNRLPSVREYFLYLIFIFIGYNVMWSNYNENITKDVLKQTELNIKHIKKLLLKYSYNINDRYI